MPIAQNHTWHKVAGSIAELSFSAEGIAAVSLDGKAICLVNFKNELYGCNAICPHASGPLQDGYIDALGHIVCPVHRYKFDIKNGRNVAGEGYSLKTYPVEERADGIYVGIDQK